MFSRSLTSFLIAIFTVACTLATFGQGASHGFREIDKNQTQRNQYQYGLVATGKDWSRYSLGANAIQDCSVRGDETWLATEAGIKRIDYAKKRIDHFSMQDGLPGEKVSAISADSEGVWAIVNTKNGDQLTSLVCRLERNAKTWKPVKSMARVAVPKRADYSYNQYSPGEPTEVGIISISPEKAAFTTSPIVTTSSCVLIYDRRLKTWQPLSIPRNLYKSEPSTLTITFVYVDRDNLWLGTNAGLFQYRHREKTWKSHLNSEIIHAGTRTTDGTIWVVAYPTVVPKNNEKPNERSSEVIRPCTLVKINPNTAPIRRYTVVTKNSYSEPVSVTGLFESKGILWLNYTSTNTYEHRFIFTQFNIQEEQFEIIEIHDPKMLNLLPPQVIQLPSFPRGKMHAARIRPLWICDDTPVFTKTLDRNETNIFYEADGSYWTWNEGKFARWEKETFKKLEEFGKWDPQLPIMSEIMTISNHQGNLYAYSLEQGIFRYSTQRKEWAITRIPFAQHWHPDSDILYSNGKRMLVAVTSGVVEYFPETDTLRYLCSTPQQSILIGMDSQGVIFRDYQNQHYRPGALTFAPESAELDPLPKELLDEYQKVVAFHAEDDIIWYYLANSKVKNTRFALIGLDQKRKTWTPPLIGENQYAVRSGLTHGTRVYFKFGEKIVVYDRQTQLWGEITTQGLGGNAISSLQLLSIDTNEIWCIADTPPKLFRYSLMQTKWQEIDIPETPALQNFYLKTATHIGDSIFVITKHGLKEYSISTNKWELVPKLHTGVVKLDNIQRKGDVIWAKANHGYGNLDYVVAYNCKTKVWQTWTEKENFPLSGNLQALAFVGDVPVIVRENQVYYLDVATNKWQNLNTRLFGNNFKVHTYNIQTDDKGVWILPSSFEGGFQQNLANSTLLRFDLETGILEPFKPTDKAVQGSRLTRSNNVLWIACSEGMYRFDSKTKEWSKPVPPKQAFGENPFVGRKAIETVTQYVLGNEKEIIVWKK